MPAFLFRWYKVQSISKMTLMASTTRLGPLLCHLVVTIKLSRFESDSRAVIKFNFFLTGFFKLFEVSEDEFNLFIMF